MKEAERLFEGGFKTLGENATLNPHGKSVLKTIISLMRPAEERAEFDGEEDRHAAKRNEGFVVKDHAGVVTESFDAPTVNVKDMRSTFETTYRWMRTLNNYNKLGDTNYSEKVEALANILKREIINKDKLWVRALLYRFVWRSF